MGDLGVTAPPDEAEDAENQPSAPKPVLPTVKEAEADMKSEVTAPSPPSGPGTGALTR